MDITVKFTKEEADAVFSQLIGRLDYFDSLIKEEIKKQRPNINRLEELKENKKKIEEATNKLFKEGASLWYQP